VVAVSLKKKADLTVHGPSSDHSRTIDPPK